MENTHPTQGRPARPPLASPSLALILAPPKTNMNQLDQLKQHTVVVADTGDFEAMKAYHDIGYDGPLRPDHAPTMEGERNDQPGYMIRGQIFAVGYMKGLIQAVRAQAPTSPAM